MRATELDYSLPRHLIAQHPVTPRDRSRLLVVDRKSGELTHRAFRDLPEYLEAGDCLVVNETRVMPFRLIGQKVEGGARIEMLLLEPQGGGRWIALAYRARRLAPGTHVRFAEDLECEIVEVLGGGQFVVSFVWEGDFDQLLERYGEVPLPPYIERESGAQPEDRKRYQTVFAQRPGSSAAPTAGLHFTPRLLERLDRQGIEIAKIVLHVGLDTFQPIQTSRVEDHPIHTEYYEVPAQAARLINETRRRGGRIVAVGTTSVRTLESALQETGEVGAGSGKTALFILPGYAFRVVDSIVTNFHLPRTTLLALISAFTGPNLWRKAYEEAVACRYRFYSYGDAMFIL